MLKPTTVIFLVAITVLAALHIIALELYLYWQIWWFDIPMHLLGGATVMLGFHTLADLRLLPRRYADSLPTALCLLLVIAIGWEAFQFAITEVMKDNYVIDTVGDIIAGLCGGVIGYVVGKRLQDLTLE